MAARKRRAAKPQPASSESGTASQSIQACTAVRDGDAAAPSTLLWRSGMDTRRTRRPARRRQACALLCLAAAALAAAAALRLRLHSAAARAAQKRRHASGNAAALAALRLATVQPGGEALRGPPRAATVASASAAPAAEREERYGGQRCVHPSCAFCRANGLLLRPFHGAALSVARRVPSAGPACGQVRLPAQRRFGLQNAP